MIKLTISHVNYLSLWILMGTAAITICPSSTHHLRQAVSKLAADRPWHCYFCRHQSVSERSVRDSLQTIVKRKDARIWPCIHQEMKVQGLLDITAYENEVPLVNIHQLQNSLVPYISLGVISSHSFTQCEAGACAHCSSMTTVTLRRNMSGMKHNRMKEIESCVLWFQLLNLYVCYAYSTVKVHVSVWCPITDWYAVSCSQVRRANACSEEWDTAGHWQKTQ